MASTIAMQAVLESLVSECASLSDDSQRYDHLGP